MHIPSVFPPCFFRRVVFVYPDADKGGTADTAESSVAYLYASGGLSGINTATTAYTITYDTFGNMVPVSAVGNGEYEDYTYDNLDGSVKVTYNGSVENAYTLIFIKIYMRILSYSVSMSYGVTLCRGPSVVLTYTVMF